jgi:hypothetical protein
MWWLVLCGAVLCKDTRRGASGAGPFSCVCHPCGVGQGGGPFCVMCVVLACWSAWRHVQLACYAWCHARRTEAPANTLAGWFVFSIPVAADPSCCQAAACHNGGA